MCLHDYNYLITSHLPCPQPVILTPPPGPNLYALVEVQDLQQSIEEIGKEEDGAKEELRVLTSRVAELEDVNKQLTGILQQEQAGHEVSTHLQVVMMCMYIQTAS